MWSTSSEIYEKFGVDKNSFDVVMIQKRRKGGIIIKGNLNIKEENTVQELEHLMEIYERKLWGKTNDYSLLLALEAGPPTPSAFVIYNNKKKEQQPYNKEINSLMENISKKYIREFHFMNLTYASNAAVPFHTVFNLTKNNTPYLILVDHNEKYEDDVDKYMFPVDQRINEENVERFLEDFRQKKLQKVIFSDPIHVNGTFRNGIHHLVGKDYENFLFRETIGKDVLFVLYSEFSEETTELLDKRIKNTIAKLEGNSHLVFAKSNPLLNEMQAFNFDSLPTLFFIKGNSETERRASIQKFNNRTYSTKDFVEFVKESSSSPVSEVALDKQDEIYTEENNDALEINTRDAEEDEIDYEEYNAGLRRYTRFILEGDDDDDDDIRERQSKKKKESKPKKDSAQKDDL